jgi:hypothetical protein
MSRNIRSSFQFATGTGLPTEIDMTPHEPEKPNRRREIMVMAIAAAVIILAAIAYVSFDGGFATAPDVSTDTQRAVGSEEMAPPDPEPDAR